MKRFSGLFLLRFVAPMIASGAAASLVACSSGPETVSSSAANAQDDAGTSATGDDGAVSANPPPPASEACTGATCSSPPATACLDAATLRTYASTGTCSDSTCSYAHTDAKCAHGCQGNACVGADPCNGVTCNSPPASSCADAATLKSFSASGTCAAGTCSYSPTTTTCACATDACVSYGPATAISVSNAQSCALTATGLKCWGGNPYGALGDGTTKSSRVPIAASNLTSITQVATGYNGTCAITSAGAVECLGTNAHGALGNGGTTDSLTAVAVTGLSSGVTAVSNGASAACVRTSAGGARCWGWNGDGQLGNGSMGDSHVPVDVQGLTSGVSAVSVGYAFACALTTAGGVKCWGSNTYGQLGNASTTRSPIPVDVQGLTSGVASISVGRDHACAVTTGGGAKCWGYNSEGELGNGSHVDSHVPVDVVGLGSGVASISSGHVHTCALTTGGGVKCWGDNLRTELGFNNSAADYSYVPVNVTGLSSGVLSIALGHRHACALLSTGGVKCWGSNAYGGELGNNSGGDSKVPVSVIGFP